MKYGLLTTSSFNIGDEIQCLAAFRFLPRVDYLVHRERTDVFKSEEPVSVIMNHWWLWDWKHFPPSACIDPLFVSFHLQYRLRNDRFLNGKVQRYFKAHEPIGCRDNGTAEFLSSKGINAYFSGCMTTTLLPNPIIKHKFMDDYILCVDVPEDVVQAIRERTERKVVCMEREQNVCFSYEQRMKLAKFALFLYHNAHCVVTIALHAALPSTAFGTPVCVIEQGTYDAKSRFDGLETCFHILNKETFLAEPEAYDINDPPPNPDTYLKIRQGLVERCKAFTGFDSEAPVLEDDYNPMADIAESLAYREENAYKSMLYAKRKSIIKAFFRRIFLIQNRHDTNASRRCADIKVLERRPRPEPDQEK